MRKLFQKKTPHGETKHGRNSQTFYETYRKTNAHSQKNKKTPTPEIYDGEEEKRMMNGKRQPTHKFYNKTYTLQKWMRPTTIPNLPSMENNQ